MVEISLCCIVDLLAAIFERNPDQLRIRYGIAPKHSKAFCLNCGKPTINEFYCSEKCQFTFCHIPLICPICDKLFYKRKSYIIYKIKKGQKQFFCSHECLGKFIAQTVGFTAHPENASIGGSLKKWNYAKIYELRKETGWGAVRIGRALGIPSSTAGGILVKEKIEQASRHSGAFLGTEKEKQAQKAGAV